MNWPQIVYIILLTINVTVNLIHNGEPTKTKYSFARSIISAIIHVLILRAGGFFE